MFLDKKYLLIIVSKLVLVFCYEHVYFNTKETKTFHIGYISGNRNKTTGKFDYYNLPGLKIRYKSYIYLSLVVLIQIGNLNHNYKFLKHHKNYY